MDWILFIVALVFFVAGAASIVSIILGLPGVWFIVALAFVIELLDGVYLSEGNEQTFSWLLLGICVGLALLGELFEFLAGVLGAKKGGASKAGMWGALIGGIIGAIMAMPFLPPIGPLIGACVGTFGGAIVGELRDPQQNIRGSLKPATGATVGRILGTLSKIPIAIAVWLALSVAAFWP